MATKTKPATAETDELEVEEPEEESEETDEERDEAVDTEPEEPTELEAGVNPEAFEAALREHERNMRAILGDAFEDLKVCDTCGGAGVHPASLEIAPDPRPDPDLVRCEACNGYGARTTPSLAQGYETSPCTVCSGTGYRSQAQLDAMRQAEAYQAQAQAPSYAPASTVPPQPVWDQARGIWTTPEGNPIYTPPAAGS